MKRDNGNLLLGRLACGGTTTHLGETEKWLALPKEGEFKVADNWITRQITFDDREPLPKAISQNRFQETQEQEQKGKLLSALSADAYLELQARMAGYHVKNFADRLGIVVRRLERHFNEEKDATPHDWLNDLRLNDARAKLANGGKISAIAVELCFVGGSQFSNWFFKNTGIRPSKFVNRKRENLTTRCRI